MDINYNNHNHNTWDFQVAIEEQPYFLWPNHTTPDQTHQAVPSSSNVHISSTNIVFPDHDHHFGILNQLEEEDHDQGEGDEELGAMKEMMYKIAAMQPVDIDPATIQRPKRRNVRISDDPQSVAARHRRERISEKIRILQRLVPGGTKMDTASMLDEAISYVKFLKRQIRLLQSQGSSSTSGGFIPQAGPGFNYGGN